MKLPKWINETSLYLLAFGLALIIRLTNLGHIPLTDSEANWALQALDTIRGSHPWLGGQVGYVQLTSLLFFITSPSNFSARLLPALFGSLLVFAPCLAGDTIGRKAAVILAFALALDPGLAAVSRQAGGAMLAIACGGLALSGWVGRKPVLAGCAVGLAVMGGESFWPVLLALLLAMGAARLFKLPAIVLNQPAEPDSNSPENPGKFLRSLIIAAAATIILVGSLFFFAPRGLGASFAGLPVYLKGWVTFSGVSSLQLLAALLVYEPLVLFLGVWGAIRAWRKSDPLDQFLGLWALIALLLSLIYPARQVGDLCGVLLPVLVLASRELARLLWVKVDFKLPTWGVALVTVIISTFLWQNLLSLSQNLQDNAFVQNQWTVIVIGLFILVIAIMLVGWGWSAQAAGMGSLWGVCAILVIYQIFSISHAAQLRPDVSAELWDRDHNIPQAGLLVSSIDQLSDTHAGRTGSLDVTVVGLQSPGLRWALRNYQNLTFVDQLPAQSQPSVVITQEEKQPQLAASYRGEGFLWYQYTDWSLMLNSEYLPWFTQHKATQQKTSLVVWVRTDIFPDAQDSSAPVAQP